MSLTILKLAGRPVGGSEVIKPSRDTITIPNVAEKYFGRIKDNDSEPYFRLDEPFLDQYRQRRPSFGFNGLGEFVFYRTYSRLKQDGSKETFLDTIRRVVEGCYEIQKRHCRMLHIPWTERKAQLSAQEMFERMWAFKFLPPGRGLWMMGTPFMWERGSAALNNCLEFSTEIITRDGIKPIGELAGTTQTLLTINGEWIDAPIRSFGRQRLMKMVLKRHRSRRLPPPGYGRSGGGYKVVYATPDHRWFARRAKNRVPVGVAKADRLKHIERKGEFVETFTKDLQPGHELQMVYGQGVKCVRPSQFGIAHGICFGDGTLGHKDQETGSYLYLCGKKNYELLKFFSESPTSFDARKGEEGAIRVADLPRHYKKAPDLRECKSYLYGWLAGYFAADGSINKKACTAHIHSSKEENMELVREVCAVLGIGAGLVRQGTQVVNHRGERKEFVGYRIYLNLEHLTEDFFLLSHHRQRFLDWQERGGWHHDRWTVESVEMTDREEEVYCATVPGKGCFALADNILTGNCGFVSTSDLSESDPAEPFCFLMDMAMLGVGVGFDTKGAGSIKIHKPNPYHVRTYQIPDSREGWVDSVRHLIRSYTTAAEEGIIEFDYSLIRKAGEPINGFGGKASGPGILMELHVLIRAHLEGRIGQNLSSVDITDLMNYIGRCVVAGNVRRCLPKGTLVHLKRGLVPIEQVQVGDLVLTADGYHQVAENVAQGVQRVVTINSQMGPFRCTDRHRIAVMNGLGQYEWKRAFELKAGDRMVFVDAVIPGTNTVLPGYSDLSTRGKPLVVPGLTTDVAWFIGAVHGDGYVYPGRRYKNRKHHGASVTIPVNRDEYHDEITAKVNAGFAAFGFNTPGEQPSQDNCRKIRVISKKLAQYLYANVKRAKTPLDVPACIRMGLPEIRAAYLAGLLDSDGSTKNRPTTLVTSVYRDFLRQVQAVYSSLGIPTKMRLRKKADAAGQAKWEIALVGEHAIVGFRRHVQPHAVKQLRETGRASGHDFGFPTSMVAQSVVSADYGRTWSTQQEQMTYHRATSIGLKTKGLIPIEVESVVDEGVTVETYDLSVPDRNEFVAEGRLVHNTAEIAFGDANDDAYCSMKNPTTTLLPEDMEAWFRITGKLLEDKRETATLGDFDGTNIPKERLVPAIKTWNALNHHRWASNNSIFAKIGMNYQQIGQQIAVNGEPGIIWLDNVRDFGRIADGRQPGIDGRVMGANPCFAGSVRLLTASGYKSMRDLWVHGGCQEYDGQPSLEKHGRLDVVNNVGIVPATNVYRTSEQAEVFRVQLSNGQFIDATANHGFVILDDSGVTHRLPLSALVAGTKLVINRQEAFGAHDDVGYAQLAGWVIGDGSLSQQRDGQVTAFAACYQSDIEEVLPILREDLLHLYKRHNRSSDQQPNFTGCERQQECFSHRQKSIRSNVLGRLLRDDGVVPGDKHRVPVSIWSGTRQTVAAFLRGFFSADGSVQINSAKKSASVRVGQKSIRLLQECQLLLGQFGITSSVLLRQNATTRLMNDGRGGKRSYKQADRYELVISSRENLVAFMDSIGFLQKSKAEKLTTWLEEHAGSHNSSARSYAVVKDVVFLGVQETFCLTEPTNNRVIANGIHTFQCMEQSLESYELCVSGDTRIQTRTGCPRIADVVGQKVDVWNGDGWSTVTPRVTGQGRELYRVHLSDGSYLDVTGNHAWPVKKPRQRIYKRVETKDLQEGWIVQGFSIVSPGGIEIEHAFELGFCAGDGFLDLVDRPRYTRPMAAICGDKAKLEQLGMGGKWYKPQIKDGYNRASMQGLFSAEQLMELRDKDAGLPDWIMAMDRDSTLQFVAGWIESDGCVCKQENTEGYRIYGLESKMRDLQLLLRRIGVNHASVNFCHPAGQETNKGVRQCDLWYVQIPSFECAEIPTRLKRAEKIGCRFRRNPLSVTDERYRGSQIDMAKKQKIVKVEKLPGAHTTYCFDEPVNHMGVFGNSLTFQCNLVETFPANHENATDYMRTLKFAYLYAKTVTLLPTHNPRTNQVTLRNRRIGLSQTGIVQAFAKFGRRVVLKDFCDAGYNEVRRWDQIYADWLCVPRSIKVTSVKPSGTVSLVAGATPGIHHPEASTYWRRVRLAKDSILVKILERAGYHIEPSITDKDRTVVVTFGVSDERVRPVADVTIWEQMQNAVDYQRYWADNQVSCTIKFKPQEAADIPRVLEAYEDQLKGISFLPHEDHGFAQAPYEPCTPEAVVDYNAKLQPADYSDYLNEAEGSKYCDNDKCVLV